MSKERELLKDAVGWMSDLSDIYADERSSDDRIKLMLKEDINKIKELLAQPETCVCQERQFRVAEKCRELEMEVGRQEARMEVGMRSINEPNPQGMAQMAHMCSDAEYAAFRKQLGFED